MAHALNSSTEITTASSSLSKRWHCMCHVSLNKHHDFVKSRGKESIRVYTGKPYVKKLMLKVRKTAPVNKTFVCLMPDLQVINNSVSCTDHTKVRIKLID